MKTIKLHHGDCLKVMDLMPENSVDAVVTDPPYELGFMGRSWDKSGIAFTPDTWAEVMRVLKPGGHIVAFGAPKNYHRLALAIEDAGFEIRDSLMWVFGAGFPKSLNVSKAIDKAAGAEREVVGIAGRSGSARSCMAGDFAGGEYMETAPATDEAKQWAGWGTALKPAYEPIVLARKPLSEKTVAANVLRWGTGALNIDGCKVGTGGDNAGRWPANLMHDGSQQVLDLFPKSGSGNGKGSYCYAGREYNNKDTSMFNGDKPQAPSNYNDAGSAARFFYSAKANKTDRAGSKHPTVKPIALMQWIVRMVTPPGGTVLDPFAGSGTTAQAAINEGFNSIIIEKEFDYITDIKNRFENKCEVQVTEVEGANQ